LPRRVLLLGASYLFYFDFSQFYILVLLFVTAITYRGALLLQSPYAQKRGTLLFWLIIPIVFSFFTFAAPGYLIDVLILTIIIGDILVRKKVTLEKSPTVTSGGDLRDGRRGSLAHG
jgi:hypothetical protein